MRSRKERLSNLEKKKNLNKIKKKEEGEMELKGAVSLEMMDAFLPAQVNLLG